MVCSCLVQVQGGEGSKEASKDAAMQELSKLMVEAKARTDQEGAGASASEVITMYLAQFPAKVVLARTE